MGIIERILGKTPAIGWECPKCGTVYSPEVTSCAKCSGKGPEKDAADLKMQIEMPAEILNEWLYGEGVK